MPPVLSNDQCLSWIRWRGEGCTILLHMIGFFVPVSLRPPVWLRLLRVRFAACVWFSSVVRMIRLFLGLDNLDPRFRDNLAIELLDTFELPVEILVEHRGISNLDGLNHNPFFGKVSLV